MKAYKYELYEHIQSLVKEQHTQQILLDMITVRLFKHLITISQEYENYWRSTKRNLQKLTQLQVIQGFLLAGI